MIIGLLGRARSGKDTVATLLQNKLTVKAGIVRLAQPIKDAVCALYNIPVDYVETDKKEDVLKDFGITPRQAMQEITDYYMRKHGHDFFSARVFKNVATNGGHVIIPDVRFRRDVEEINSYQGIVIKVVRPQNATFYTCEHTVDTCPCDFTVVNDGTLDDLDTKIQDIVNQISHKLHPQ